MKLFGRSSGYYLFWAGFIYFWVGIYLAFTHAAPTEYATLGFVLALSVPLWCPPVARYFNMEPLMFNLFGKKDKTPNNVVPFPKPEVVPEPTPPSPYKKDAKELYRFGLTDDGRMTFTMGYTTLTMTREGVEQLIYQLEFFRDQIPEYKEHDNV